MPFRLYVRRISQDGKWAESQSNEALYNDSPVMCTAAFLVQYDGIGAAHPGQHYLWRPAAYETDEIASRIAIPASLHEPVGPGCYRNLYCPAGPKREAREPPGNEPARLKPFSSKRENTHPLVFPYLWTENRRSLLEPLWRFVGLKRKLRQREPTERIGMQIKATLTSSGSTDGNKAGRNSRGDDDYR